MRIYSYLLVFLLVACGAPKSSITAENTKVEVLSADVSKTLQFLTSDDLQGRDTGSEGIETAAVYLENILKENGIKPYFKTYRDTLSNFTKPAYNVVGFIEGTDPKLKNEFVIIGAHYDHWGWGGKGSGSKKKDTIAIHNGADDNASGVSALLCILEEVSKLKVKPKRSIIFISFSGEEEGLIGSKYFVNHLPVKKEAVKVMLNMDMVGRLNAEKQIYMGGAGTFPNGFELMKKLGDNSGLNPVVFAGDVGGSDHVSFYKASISAIGFHTGGHPQYHTPEDDIELINFEGGALVSKYICNALVSIANYNEELIFIKQD